MPQSVPISNYSEYSLEAVFTDPAALLPYMSAVRYHAGEIMICNFLSEKKIYIVTEGRFNLYYYRSDGEQLFIRSCEAVIMAGEMEFVKHFWQDLHEPVQKEFYFEMLTDCSMIVLNYNMVQDILISDSRFLSFVCRSLVEKFNDLADMEIAANVNSSSARVAGYLLSASDAQGVWKGNQKYVAEQLRISYRHLHRVLKEFIDAGCIVRTTGGYMITDTKKLKEYLV